MKYVISVEFGGQSVKAARVSSNGDMSGPFKLQLDQKNPLKLDKFLEGLRKIIHQAKGSEEILAVGVGAPNPYDDETLTFHLGQKPAYKYINNQPLKEEILKIVGCDKFFVMYDAGVAYLGEIWKGEMKPKGRFILLTLGTGLGACFVEDGEIVKGRDGVPDSGEIWDYQFMGENFEENAGTTKSIVKIYKKLGGTDKDVLSGNIEHLAELAKNNDNLAVNSFREFGRLLGEGLKEIVSKFKPESIILSGNIANSFDLFSKDADRALDTDKVEFVKSDLIDKGGLLGAAQLAFLGTEINPS